MDVQNNVRLDEGLIAAIEKRLNEGYLVEIMKLRDGTIKARSIKKKEIFANPDAR